MARLSATPLAIPEVLMVQPSKFGDHRGYFLETFSHRDFGRLGIGNKACIFSSRRMRKPSSFAFFEVQFLMSRSICGAAHPRSDGGAVRP
jgi:hypothetical protein